MIRMDQYGYIRTAYRVLWERFRVFRLSVSTISVVAFMAPPPTGRKPRGPAAGWPASDSGAPGLVPRGYAVKISNSAGVRHVSVNVLLLYR